MSIQAKVPSNETRPLEQGAKPLDPAVLGRTWVPQQALEVTPEVSYILDEMPWWAARGLVYIIAGFLVVALVWSYFGRVDVIIEARGALTPEGYLRPVQAAVGGIVQYIFIHEGDTVENGQPLLQLDSAELRSRVSKLREELTTSREQFRQLRSLKGPVTETLEQENRIARLQSEVLAAELNLKHTIVVAPVAGVVTTWEARGAGTVLQSGQNIATIAPANARLLAEARIQNKDIALVERGLPVKLKFDAFPFLDYGLVSGAIVEIAVDAETGKEGGSFYKVKIAPDRTSVIANGKSVSLRPGLTLTAEIVTDRKSILNLMLDPFRKLKARTEGVK